MTTLVGEMSGKADLDKVIDELGLALSIKEIRKAGRLSMIPMRDFAKQLAPFSKRTNRRNYRTGNPIHLRDDIKISTKKTQDKNVVVSLRTTKHTMLYASLVEFGREEFIQKRWHYFGIPLKEPMHIKISETKGTFFMTLAFAAKRNETVEIFQEELQKGLRRAIKRKRKAG